MLRHFITAFTRIIRRNSLSFFIKSIGLVASLTVTLLIASYIYDEVKYDRFHRDTDNIYRITTTSNFKGNENRYSRTPLPLAEKISDLKSIESVGRIFTRGITVSLPETEKKFNEPNVWFADSSITGIFSFSVIRGDLEHALTTPNSLILSKEAALRYFNSTDIIGKSVVFENQTSFRVDAVVDDYPNQSSLKFNFIVPFNSLFQFENPGNVAYLKSDWVYSSVFTFIKSHSNRTQRQITAEIKSVHSTISDQRVKENIKYTAQALADIHLHSSFTGEQTHERIAYVYVFAAIGVALFIIAIINYISLTSAEWIARNKELTIRLIIGSSKTQMILQFLTESALFTFFLLPTVLLATFLVLPHFNRITQKQLMLDSLVTWPVITSVSVAILIYVLGTAILLMIGSKNKMSAVKHVLKSDSPNLPRGLVFQGALTIILSTFALIVHKQLLFFENQSLGFQKENMITVPLFSENFNSIIGQVTGDLRGRMNFFEAEVLNHGAIEAISCSAFKPGEGTISALTKTDSLSEKDNVFLSLNSVDYDFLDTYKIKILAGRNFSREYGTDHEEAFIINEEAVKKLGLKTPEFAIGTTVEAVGKKGKIIGVMQNFNFEGLQNQIHPLIFEVAAWKFSTFSIRLNDRQKQTALEILSNKWREVFPEVVFQYKFLEDDLAENYEFENSLSQLTQAVTSLTVLLSLLGIYASAILHSFKRTKELTVRKILGATSFTLIQVFIKPFVNVVLVSFALSVPVVWLLSDAWLERFAYRISLQPTDLLFVLVMAVGLIFIVLVQQLWKIIRLDPVKNLRNE
jgi:putative ABC transport system permease protein